MRYLTGGVSNEVLYFLCWEYEGYDYESVSPMIPVQISPSLYFEETSILKSYAEAGVTWWQEGFLGNDTLNDVRERIYQGPPSF
jgi:hypothetical protein